MSLIVEDESPPGAKPDGSELDDEVNLRGLPKCGRSPGTTTSLGKRVAFRAPLWKAIFGDDYPAPPETHIPDAWTGHVGELARCKAKLMKLSAGYQAEWLRIGTLTGYDPVTDHAVVTIEMPKGDIHIHASLTWTMEWTMPPAAGTKPPPARAPELPMAPLAPQAPAAPKPVDPRDVYGAELARRKKGGA